MRGSAGLPGDKSLSHRAALFAAIANGESRVENFLFAGVTQVMLEALSALGVQWSAVGSTLSVSGRGIAGLQPPAGPVDCGNSATTLRLLAGVLAASGLAAELDGSPGLRRRPMRRIVEPLQAMGVPVESTPGGTAPLRFSNRPANRPLQPLDYTLPVASAQVKSCLLFAALAAGGTSRLYEPTPSRDHTERILHGLGLSIERKAGTAVGDWQPVPFEAGAHLDFERPVMLAVHPPDPLVLPPVRGVLPGDISSAAFLIVVALIVPGSEIRLQGVGLNPTRTGLLEVLRDMGGEIQVEVRGEQSGEPFGDLQVRASRLRGGRVDAPLAVRMIDEFPAFAVAAALAEGETVVRGASELRYKESDRIGTLCAELRKLGADVLETKDGFIIRGGRGLSGGEVAAHGDHRLAMALAVAGLAAGGPVTVRGAETIAESFPGFLATLQGLGADMAYRAGE